MVLTTRTLPSIDPALERRSGTPSSISEERIHRPGRKGTRARRHALAVALQRCVALVRHRPWLQTDVGVDPGVFRDAVRSTTRRTVHAPGLNLVVLTLRVTPPWGGMPVGLPLTMRLHRRGDNTSLIGSLCACVTTTLVAVVHGALHWRAYREPHLWGNRRMELQAKRMCEAQFQSPLPSGIAG